MKKVKEQIENYFLINMLNANETLNNMGVTIKAIADWHREEIKKAEQRIRNEMLLSTTAEQIKKANKDILEDYTQFLLKHGYCDSDVYDASNALYIHGYCDSDVYDEEPYAISEFLKENEGKNAKEDNSK